MFIGGLGHACIPLPGSSNYGRSSGLRHFRCRWRAPCLGFSVIPAGSLAQAGAALVRLADLIRPGPSSHAPVSVSPLVDTAWQVRRVRSDAASGELHGEPMSQLKSVSARILLRALREVRHKLIGRKFYAPHLTIPHFPRLFSASAVSQSSATSRTVLGAVQIRGIMESFMLVSFRNPLCNFFSTLFCPFWHRGTPLC